MTTELTAAEICNLLNLEPNATCGSVRVSFVSQQSIAERAGQELSRHYRRSARHRRFGAERRA
jgi:hypothetical protein